MKIRCFGRLSRPGHEPFAHLAKKLPKVSNPTFVFFLHALSTRVFTWKWRRNVRPSKNSNPSLKRQIGEAPKISNPMFKRYVGLYEAPLLGAQDNAQTPKVRTLCWKWQVGVLSVRTLDPKPNRSAQSLNPFLKIPLEVLPHTVDQKSSQNIIINSCFEHVLGRLAKLGKFIFSTGPGHMAEVSYPFPKTSSKWQGGAPWSSEGANPLLKMASWTVLEHSGYWTTWPKSRTLSPKRFRLLGHMAEVAYPFPKTV